MNEDGGPAFPTADNWADRGMSLRDYFAARAMQLEAAGIMQAAAEGSQIAPGDIPTLIAKGSYAIAEAMILERSKT